MAKTYYKVEIGSKYGKLTVLNKIHMGRNKYGKSLGYKYECICECGNKGLFQAPYLVKGISTQCKNCIAKQMRKIFIKEGDKFGRLTVISSEPLKRRGYHDQYLCRCECGDEKYYINTKLNMGYSTECRSCAYSRRPQSTTRLSNLERAYNAFLYSSNSRSLEVNITIEEFAKLISGNCAYCGAQPTNIKLTDYSSNKIVKREQLYGNGIDRVDSSKGYVLENCVPCCINCNFAKRSLTKEEFIEHIIKIYNHLCKQEDTQKEN
jgi:hypothetical protein